MASQSTSVEASNWAPAMIPSSYQAFFSASTSASAALIGFLFVSVSIASAARADANLTNRSHRAEGLVDIRPVAVSLEDDLAAVAAKHDLDVPLPDRLRIAAADRARSRLFHVHRRDRIDLDL